MYKYGLAILQLFCVYMIHHTTYFNVANENRGFHCYRKMLEPRVHLAHGTYSGGITNKEQVQVRRNPVVLEYIGMCRDELRFCPKNLSAHI